MTNTSPIVVEVKINATSSRIWKALTDEEQMRAWFFENMKSFEARVGFETRFSVFSNGKEFVHVWKVLEVEKEKRLVLDWRYPNFKGESTATFEIETGDSSCVVKVIADGVHTFPQDIEEFKRESCEGGWNYFMNRLKNYVVAKP